MNEKLRSCQCCREKFSPDLLNTVDTESYGVHETIEVCEVCYFSVTTKAPTYNPNVDVKFKDILTELA